MQHECLLTEPHQTTGQYLWFPSSRLPAQTGAAAVQGNPALPAQAAAAQSPLAIPVPSFPLAVWAQTGGKMEWDRGVGGQGGPGLSEHGHG